MRFLKQSTAAVIPFGPALLPADGVTLVTTLVSALDHASTGIFLWKNGGAGAIRHASVTATTYDAYGMYLVTLDATDTNTLGRLRVGFAAAANTLPIWDDFEVLPANVFDSLVSASADLKVDVDTIKTQAITCAAGVTVLASVGTAATNTAQTGDSFARLGAPAGASVSADVAAVKTETASIQTDTNDIQTRLPAALVSGRMDASVGAMAANVLTAASMDADASAEIADAVWDEAISGHLGAGSTGAALNAAGSAGDPWATGLPGAYAPGEAGFILGTNLDAVLSVVAAALPTAAENATELLDQAAGVETNRTIRQALRLILASAAAKLSGAATATVVIRDTNDTKNRITATVDQYGNRSAVTYDTSD